MPNEWIEKLKRFNADGGVWAIPRKNTDERKMLDRGQRFKYSLLKERFPDLSRQLEEEVSSREAKAKMRKAEELIKQAEAMDNVVKKRKLRILPKEEEAPPPLESAEAPIRPENKKRENEEKESPPKTDSVAGDNKMSIYNKMEGKTIEGPKTATEYYYYVGEFIHMPQKAIIKYIDEQGVSKEERRLFLVRTTRDKKNQTDSEFQFEKWEKLYEKQYKQWLDGIDPLYEQDRRAYQDKNVADSSKKLRDEAILRARKKAEEEKKPTKEQLRNRLTQLNNQMEQNPEYKENFEKAIKEVEKQLEELEAEEKPKTRKLKILKE